MKLGDDFWITEDWGFCKSRSGLTGRVHFLILFTKDMRAVSGPHHYSKLQAKKDIWRMIK
jgi:hypothetical protein